MNEAVCNEDIINKTSKSLVDEYRLLLNELFELEMRTLGKQKTNEVQQGDGNERQKALHLGENIVRHSKKHLKESRKSEGDMGSAKSCQTTKSIPKKKRPRRKSKFCQASLSLRKSYKSSHTQSTVKSRLKTFKNVATSTRPDSQRISPDAEVTRKLSKRHSKDITVGPQNSLKKNIEPPKSVSTPSEPSANKLEPNTDDSLSGHTSYSSSTTIQIEHFTDHLERKLLQMERRQYSIAKDMIAEICKQARRGNLSKKSLEEMEGKREAYFDITMRLIT
ncbi:unnamed protein product [Hermetia illucens]|uniref:Uncharacterized protein n=1 Tax=Hermetia illucens TaxID=343691 RepID=A0A7R8YXC5_HERIL|nr:unnamed protein product [Hermetia illucens]